MTSPPTGTSSVSSRPLLLRALEGQDVERTPIWLMRQAGRYLPEYRAIRERYSFLEMCRSPEVAAEVTLQPVRRFGLDAAVLFSDILLVLDAMGAGVRFAEGEGPVISNPVRTAADMARLPEVDPDRDLRHVAETIRMVVRELPPEVPLIGFAGAPFTLMTYLVEGGKGERGQAVARALLLQEPEAAHTLLQKLAAAVLAQLLAQVRAGARVVQLFDTWAGTLSPPLLRTFALPYVRQVVDALSSTGVPTLYFARGSGALLPHLPGAGATAYGLDWTCDLREARRILGPDVPVQGNLDPAVLLTTPEVVRREARAVLEAAGPRGHVFNLGHGVLPGTDPSLVATLVETVRKASAREGGGP